MPLTTLMNQKLKVSLHTSTAEKAFDEGRPKHMIKKNSLEIKEANPWKMAEQ